MEKAYLDEDHVHSKVSTAGMFRRLLPYLLRHWKEALIVVFMMVSLNVVARLLPTVFGWAIDFGILKKDMSFVTRMAMVYLGLEIARTVLTYLNSYLFQKLGNKILFEIREEVIAHVQSLPIRFFDKNPIGRIVTRVTNDVQGLAEFFNQGLVTILTSFLSIASIITAMALISAKLSLIALITAPLVYFVVMKISRKILVVFRDGKAKVAEINAFVAENISGMKLIQLYDRITKNQDRFFDLSDSNRKIQFRSVTLYATLWPLLNLFNAATIVAAMYFGGWLQGMGEIQIGALVAFFMHVQDFHPPLRNMLERYIQFQNSLTSAERIFSLLDQKAETSMNEVDDFSFRGEVTFKDLYFRYDKNLPWVLNGIHLKIAPGESIAIVGATGSGKSTMIALLQRFYDFEKGDILLDGTSLLELPRRTLRRSLGVVQQDPFLFRGTIAENIHLNDKKISASQVELAVRMSHCQDILSRHEGGLDAIVEERGNNLSAGEKQLIAFARILAFDPRVLILDEATANIDSETELIIKRATEELTKNRTSIIIAHRLSTILHCDRIVFLENGRIREVGSHAQLMQKRGPYYNLYNSQTTPSTPKTV